MIFVFPQKTEIKLISLAFKYITDDFTFILKGQISTF